MCNNHLHTGPHQHSSSSAVFFSVFCVQEPAYTPQVEAISPTLPTEDSSNRQFKEELLQNISKKDGEITAVEAQIAKLRKKEVMATQEVF